MINEWNSCSLITQNDSRERLHHWHSMARAHMHTYTVQGGP